MGRRTSKPQRKEKSHALFWVLILFFIIRLIYILELKNHPLFNDPVVDSDAFLQSARFILSGNILGNQTWQGPLYSYFLALLLSITDSLLFVRILQAGLSTLGCWFLYRLLRRSTDQNTAIVGCFLFAIYGPLIYFDGEILATSLHTILNIGVLFLLTEADARDRWHLFLTAGAVLGLSATARGTILLLLPFLFVWLIIKSTGKRTLSRALWNWALVMIGTSLILSVNLLRNHRLSGEIIPVSPGMGINLHIGNNEHAWETMKIRPGAEWELLSWEPVRQGLSSPGEQSEYFTGKALQFISSHPIDEIKLLLGKLIQFMGSEEIIRNFDFYEMRKYSWTLSALLWKGILNFPFGIFLPLAITGIWLNRHRWRREFLLLSYMASVALSNVVFFPTARYRVPMVPIMLYYSSVSLIWLYEKIRHREWDRSTVPLALSGCLIVGLNIGISPRELKTGGEEEFHIGMLLERHGDLDGAESWFQAALKEDPGYAEAHFFMGKIHWMKGEKELAVVSLNKALSLLPDFAEANALLGHISISSGGLERALNAYQKALRVKPDMTQVRYNIAMILLQLDQLDGAILELKTVVRANPQNHLALFALGQCLEQKDKKESALSFYTRAIAANPRNPRPYISAGKLLLDMGRKDEAKSFLRKASQLDPENDEVRSLLKVSAE